MQITNKIKSISGLKKIYRSMITVYSRLVLIPRKVKAINKEISNLKALPAKKFVGDEFTDVIVSFTSYPARVDKISLTVESLFNQEVAPYKILLVLSEEEFPDRNLSKSVQGLVDRGLEVLWVEQNTRSYKKLLPVQAIYPNNNIITVDDDVIYKSNLVKDLLNKANDFPGCVIGNRGRIISKDNRDFMPYQHWPLIGKEVTGSSVLLTGMGGIYYPAGVLDSLMLQDIEKAKSLCPNADDFWFWVTSVVSNACIVCTAQENYIEIEVEVVEESLSSTNLLSGQNDVQFENLLKVYDLSSIE